MIYENKHNLANIMIELEALEKEQTKKTFIRHGAHEPLFGVNIGEVIVNMGDTSCKTPLASSYIQNSLDKNRQGYKRKNLRC